MQFRRNVTAAAGFFTRTLLLSVFVPLCMPAQAPNQEPAVPPAVVPGAANTISIDVRVTDKLGHHIGGLKAEDFTLTDNKLARPIVDFHEMNSRDSTDSALHVIIVIDTINTTAEVVAREREQLQEFLKQDGGRLSHQTSIAILTEKGAKLEPASTNDGGKLLSVLDANGTTLRSIGRSGGFWGATERLQWSLQQMAQLSEYEAKLPGRKLAFFLSPGWPMLVGAGIEEDDKQRQTTFRYIVGLTNGLRQAKLTLYTLDPFSLGRTDPFYYQTYLKGVPNANKAEYPDLGLQVLAAHTGGLVQVDGMDILGEINNAMRDADSWYTLTFEPPTPDKQNEYHDLHVQVKSPGATVRTTSGYYANVNY
jgi:VWFA-related protein